MAGLLQSYYFPTDFFYPKPKQLSIKSDNINNNNNSSSQHRHPPPQPQRRNLDFEGSAQVDFDSDDSDKKMMNRSVSGRDLRMPAKAVKASISLQGKNLDSHAQGKRIRILGRVEKH